jgi:hypothetical protein
MLETSARQLSLLSLLQAQRAWTSTGGRLADPGGDRARARGYVRGWRPIPVEVESLGEDRCAFEPARTVRRCSPSSWGCGRRTSRSRTRRSWWTRYASWQGAMSVRSAPASRRGG